MAITKEELLKGRDKDFPGEYTTQISDNLDILVEKLNVVRAAYGKPMVISSGWRPKIVNTSTPNAAPNSAHMTGEAADILDKDGSLRDWVLLNLDLMKSVGLFIEDFRYTNTWVHFGTRKPLSGKRIFIPQKGLPPYPERWLNPKYDSKYDSKP